ncbi:hypothetical protein QBC44DRAFT_165996 [Cladorrhinum sp. PSN332]|nr:hypothetical protein QBC44DRAFT_165996 [Cladorrhinum sp. PSN332]
MHLNNLVLVGGASLAAAQVTVTDIVSVPPTSVALPTQTISVPATSAGSPTSVGSAVTTGSPCLQLYSEFFKHPELTVPAILGFYQAESTKKYFSTRIEAPTSRLSFEPTDEEISSACARRLGDRTLTDLPEDVQTTYSSFTSQWSSFVATAKTEASSVATVCLDAGATGYAAHLLDAVATEVAECVANRRLVEPGPTTSPAPPTGTDSSFTTTTTTATSGAAGGTGAASSSSSGRGAAVTAGAPRETGYAVAAVVAVAGVVGLL